MVKMDGIAQWLAGDELKRDQFKFLYNTMEIIYECALRDYMLAEDHKVIDQVVPNLTAYRALLVMKDIDERKAEERKKE